MSFQEVAALLLPADGEGTALETGDDWRTAGAAGANVWGRGPTWVPAERGLVAYAARRERALARLRARPPAGLSVAGVHRWPHAFFQARYLPRTLDWLRAGALVELKRGSGTLRVVDVAAAAAGITRRVGALHFGAGGQISTRGPLAAGPQALLRVARTGAPVDPGRGAEALERLEQLSLPRVPLLLGRGHAGIAAWTAETLLPGRPAATLDPALAAAAADFCLGLPRAAGPPTAFGSDIASLVDRLPRFAERLLELEARAAPAIATLPSVLRHGDLWLGNLLVERGELVGVIDWDAWNPAGVPGTDLLHLVASTQAFACGQSFGELMAQRPWERPAFAATAGPYWAALAIEPTTAVLEAIGVAWWAMHTRANLQRHPHMAADERWLARSVESLLGS